MKRDSKKASKKPTTNKPATNKQDTKDSKKVGGKVVPPQATSRRYANAAELKDSFDPKCVAIMYRPGTPEAVKEACKLATWLLKKGFEVYSTPGQEITIKSVKEVTHDDLDRLDLVVALGGDGTYLRAVRLLEGRQTPILGINMGNLGFLTVTRRDDLYEALEATLKNKMDFRPRSTLKIELRRNGKVRAEHIALNDAVLERGSNTHLINMEMVSQDHQVAVIKADALIVASPTGSTAYNLAAGGPILHPEARAIVVTPVCPHALTSRPLIFPDQEKLCFKVLSRDNSAILTVDGVNCGEITVEDEVIVVRNELDHFVIRKPSSNYFSLLREKLKFGERN